MFDTQKNQKTLGGILTFFRVIYALTLITGGFVLLLCIIVPFQPDVRDEFCRLPVDFTLDDGSISLDLGREMHTATLERTTGELQIQGGPLLLSYANLLFGLVLLAFILYCVRLTIRIVERIREGNIFLLENALALRRIAWASLLLFVFLFVTRFGFSLLVPGRILSKGLVITGFLGSRFDLSLAELAAPLFLLALAEAFRAGVSMQEDRDLTV